MQTTAEKVEALKTLLPCLTMHLYHHPYARVVPEARWVSEGEPPPAHVPPPPCDFRCGTCRLECKDEGWIGEYWWLRRRYPILWQIESLLKAMGDVREGHRWLTAIRYIYLEPCDVFSHGPWPGYANQGLVWLAEALGNQYIPTYVADDDAKAQRRWMRSRRHEQVRVLAGEGLSQETIAERTGYKQGSISKILAAHVVRSGSTRNAGS